MIFFPLIRDRQKDYYDVLAQSDNSGESTVFIEFILESILTTIEEIASDQVKALLDGISGVDAPLSAGEIMIKLGLSHRTNFRNHYLQPALDAGIIEMTIPEKPNSSLQKYRLTAKGKRFLNVL